MFVGILTSSSCLVSGVLAQVPASSQESLAQREEQATTWVDADRDRPASLRAFVQRMPKGGDIHSHLSGAVYAERYLEWAAEDGYCIDPDPKILVEPKACGQDSRYAKLALN